MNGTQQPEALRLADKYEIEGFLQDHRFAQDHWCRQAAAELRRQHARIAELEEQISAIGAGGVEPLRKQAVPIGWREQFATEVYADLEAADNQDVPLEEYPARILKVLDSTVGPRHPVVIKWRNDAIEQCIAIALKYCRDPESHKYLKQDLEAMLASAPAHPAEGVPAQTDHATEFAPPNSLPTFDECVQSECAAWKAIEDKLRAHGITQEKQG